MRQEYKVNRALWLNNERLVPPLHLRDRVYSQTGILARRKRRFTDLIGPSLIRELACGSDND
ncbi:hypothetical protein PtrSN001A_008630 [Pyrenophora tritici-repentis]|nr:hypothetical protein PtrSN001A_008630 [Pyrenophora tritici-repentis]